MIAESPFSFLGQFPSEISTSIDAEGHLPEMPQTVLTSRQEVIALLIAAGITCNTIAGELQIPVRAVEGHVYRILVALELSVMTDLTQEAMKRYRARTDSRLEPRMEPAVPDLLTVDEIARSMRVSKMTVYRLIRAGSLDCVRFGRSYRVERPALQRYLDSLTAG